jgi:hypothetical protein
MHSSPSPSQTEDGPFEFLHMELVSILLANVDANKQTSCPGSGDVPEAVDAVSDLPVRLRR